MKRALGLLTFFIVAFVPAYVLDIFVIIPSIRKLLALPLLVVRMWFPTLGAVVVLLIEKELYNYKEILRITKPKARDLLLSSLIVIAGYTLALGLSPLMGIKIGIFGPLRELSEAFLGIKASFLIIIILILLGIAAGISINALVALGEEMGWRGYLLSRFSEKLDLGTSSLLVGILWGIWHGPLIAKGYNYSTAFLIKGALSHSYNLEYILIFTLTTSAMGIVLAELRVLFNSVLLPAAAHGTINAVAGLFTYMTLGSRTLSPPAGLSVALAFSILSLVLGWEVVKRPRKTT